MNRFYRFINLILFLSIINGQDSTRDIAGSILDMDNLEPLPYANIIIQGTGRGVTSDADGHFVLVDVPAEPCSLIISYIGYRTAKIGFDNSISQGPLEIRLKLEALNFQAVDVLSLIHI